MYLSEIVPSRDSWGRLILKIYRIRAVIGECTDKRPGVQIAASLDGRWFIPVSSENDLYVPEKHVLLSSTYEFFATTGLDQRREHHLLLDYTQVTTPLEQNIMGWLRGPIVDEIVARSHVPVSGERQNPSSDGDSLFWIKPWVHDIEITYPREQNSMESAYRTVVKGDGGIRPGMALYDVADDSIAVSNQRNGYPLFTQWAVAFTELSHVRLSSYRALWSELLRHHPHVIRPLLLTYTSHVPRPPDMEVDDVGVERMALAGAVLTALGYGIDECLPKRIDAYVQTNYGPYFRVPVEAA